MVQRTESVNAEMSARLQSNTTIIKRSTYFNMLTSSNSTNSPIQSRNLISQKRNPSTVTNMKLSNRRSNRRSRRWIGQKYPPETAVLLLDEFESQRRHGRSQFCFCVFAPLFSHKSLISPKLTFCLNLSTSLTKNGSYMQHGQALS